MLSLLNKPRVRAYLFTVGAFLLQRILVQMIGIEETIAPFAFSILVVAWAGWKGGWALGMEITGWSMLLRIFFLQRIHLFMYAMYFLVCCVGLWAIEEIRNRRLHEEALEKRLQMATDSTAYTVHHQNNIATSVLLLIQKLRRHIDARQPTEVAQTMSLLEVVADELKASSLELCEVRRLESDLKLEFQGVHLQAFLASIYRLYLQRSLFHEKEISFFFDARTSRMVRTNPEILNKAICELLQNAEKYCPPLGLVSLRAWCDRAFCFIEVANTGTIPYADLPHIFELFYRGKSDQPGSGIGLYYVRLEVELIKGSISVSLDNEQGLVKFTIKLPA